MSILSRPEVQEPLSEYVGATIHADRLQSAIGTLGEGVDRVLCEESRVAELRRDAAYARLYNAIEIAAARRADELLAQMQELIELLRVAVQDGAPSTPQPDPVAR